MSSQASPSIKPDSEFNQQFCTFHKTPTKTGMIEVFDAPSSVWHLLQWRAFLEGVCMFSQFVCGILQVQFPHRVQKHSCGGQLETGDIAAFDLCVQTSITLSRVMDGWMKSLRVRDQLVTSSDQQQSSLWPNSPDSFQGSITVQTPALIFLRLFSFFCSELPLFKVSQLDQKSDSVCTRGSTPWVKPTPRDSL